LIPAAECPVDEYLYLMQWFRHAARILRRPNVTGAHMNRLRRTVALAMAAAAGASPAAHATSNGETRIASSGCAKNGHHNGTTVTGAVICGPWSGIGDLTSGSIGQAASVCAYFQNDDATVGVGIGTSVPVCFYGQATAAGVEAVSPAVKPDSPLFLCTYGTTAGSNNEVYYDADHDASNGDQCEPVRRQTDTNVLASPNTVTLLPGVKPFTDPVVDPDPNCAGCLSGIDPWTRDVYDAVLAVDLQTR
jgi:hypothetical protein